MKSKIPKTMIKIAPIIPPIIPPFAPELKPLDVFDVGVTVGVEVKEVLVEVDDGEEPTEVVLTVGLEFAGGAVANAPIPVKTGVPDTTGAIDGNNFALAKKALKL